MKRGQKRYKKRRTVTHPDYAQCITHIPHALNNRLNSEAMASGMTKANYVGAMLSRIEDAVVLPQALLSALDRWAKGQRLTRAEAARLLLQRSLREMGVLGS